MFWLNCLNYKDNFRFEWFWIEINVNILQVWYTVLYYFFYIFLLWPSSRPISWMLRRIVIVRWSWKFRLAVSDDVTLHLDCSRFLERIFQRKNEKNEYKVKLAYFHFLWHCYAFIAFERTESWWLKTRTTSKLDLDLDNAVMF